MGLGAAALNMTTLRPVPIGFSDKALARCAGALVFVFQFGIITANFVTMHPHILAEAVSDRVDSSTLRDRHTEFILDACIDWSLSLIGVALAFVSSPIMDAGDPRADRNRFVGTFVFNNVFLGTYGSAVATRMDFALQNANLSHASTVAASFLSWFWFLSLPRLPSGRRSSGLSLTETGAALAKNAFRAAGGTRAPIVILWRVAIAAGVVSGVIACFSASSPWFTFTIEAGTIPKEIGIHAENVEDLISELSHSALGVVKKMDPCRWSISKPSEALNSSMSYAYPPEYSHTMTHKSFSLSTAKADISEMDCKCRAAGACDCETMHAARAHVATKRQDKADFAATSNISYVRDEVTHFRQITEDVMYDDAMKKCHAMECDIVLGVAVTAESRILASGTVWLIPGLEDAISTAAWFGQLVNRVGHGVLKYGPDLQSS